MNNASTRVPRELTVYTPGRRLLLSSRSGWLESVRAEPKGRSCDKSCPGPRGKSLVKIAKTQSSHLHRPHLGHKYIAGAIDGHVGIHATGLSPHTQPHYVVGTDDVIGGTGALSRGAKVEGTCRNRSAPKMGSTMPVVEDVNFSEIPLKAREEAEW